MPFLKVISYTPFPISRTRTSWHFLVFSKTQLVISYTVFLVCLLAKEHQCVSLSNNVKLGHDVGASGLNRLLPAMFTLDRPVRLMTSASKVRALTTCLLSPCFYGHSPHARQAHCRQISSCEVRALTGCSP